MTAMHVAANPLNRDEIDEIVFSPLALTTEMWARRASGETTLLLNELADLGILNVVNDEVALTGLGTALLIEHLRADGRSTCPSARPRPAHHCPERDPVNPTRCLYQ